MSGMNRYTLLPFQCIIRATVGTVVHIIQRLYLLHGHNAEVMQHSRAHLQSFSIFVFHNLVMVNVSLNVSLW